MMKGLFTKDEIRIKQLEEKIKKENEEKEKLMRKLDEKIKESKNLDIKTEVIKTEKAKEITEALEIPESLSVPIPESKKPKMEEQPQTQKHPYIDKVQKPFELQAYKIWKKGGFFARFKRKWKYKRMNPHKTLLINMELDIGDHISFLIYKEDGGFIYKKKQYVIDYESSYYNQSHGLWCYDFHEGLSLPIKRRLEYNIIKDTINTIDEDDNIDYAQIKYSINPKLLYEFCVSKIIEGILRGAELEAWLKRIFLLIIISLMGIVISAIVLFVKIGAIEKLIKG